MTAPAVRFDDPAREDCTIRGQALPSDFEAELVEPAERVADDEHLSNIEWRVAARKGKLKAMAEPDRAAQSRQAGVRTKGEHPFLILKRDFGFAKTRYRGIGKNLNHLHVAFASANWLMRARAVTLMG